MPEFKFFPSLPESPTWLANCRATTSTPWIATALAHEAQLASLDNKFSLYEELVDTLVNREDSP